MYYDRVYDRDGKQLYLGTPQEVWDYLESSVSILDDRVVWVGAHSDAWTVQGYLNGQGGRLPKALRVVFLEPKFK